MTRAQQTREVEAQARAQGFDKVGIARVADSPGTHEARFVEWLRRGYAAGMTYLVRRAAERADVRRLAPWARSVIVVAANYYTPPGAAPPARRTLRGRVARYAWGRDYHRVLGKKLRRLRRALEALAPGGRFYLSVDTGAVLEKAWAERAGLGWIGKHSNLITRDLGSWVFLGALITDLDLAPDVPEPDHCGTCDLCLRACPTGAIVEPYVVDGGKCIAYHTIEHRGTIPDALRAPHGDWVFGCDECQDVCPWNRFAQPTGDPDFAPRPEQAAPSLVALLAMSPDEAQRRLPGTPLARAGREGLARSAAVALGNQLATPGALDADDAHAALRALGASLEDPSPTVREAAAWAIAQGSGSTLR